MKTCLIWVMAMVGLVQTGCAQTNAGKSGLEKLAWLEGTWDRQGMRGEEKGFEHWVMEAGELRGQGVTMRGADTVFVEKLSVVMRDGAAYYVAEVPQNPEPTYFKITEMTESGFVSENPDHDFPKKIAYMLEGNRLRAVISGDGKEMAFEFLRRP